MKWIIGLVVSVALVAAPCAGFARGSHSGGSHSSRSYSSRSSSSRSYSTHDHVVSGYTRKNGTYVPSYHATNPDSTRNNNYSTRGNTNPYTGRAGTKPRDGE